MPLPTEKEWKEFSVNERYVYPKSSSSGLMSLVNNVVMKVNGSLKKWSTTLISAIHQRCLRDVILDFQVVFDTAARTFWPPKLSKQRGRRLWEKAKRNIWTGKGASGYETNMRTENVCS